MVNGELACRQAFATVQAYILVPCVDVTPCQRHALTREAVIINQPNYSWYSQCQCSRVHPVELRVVFGGKEVGLISPPGEIEGFVAAIIDSDDFSSLAY